MEISSYKGDSPNKKMVRALAWTYGIDLMKELHQVPKGAYVLAGHGGDIRTIKGVIDRMYPRESDFKGPYGIIRHPEEWLHRPADFNLTAVDYDQDLIDQLYNNVGHIAQEPETGIASVEGYVGDAARLVRRAKPYNMSHMDFCNAVSVDNVYTVAEVIKNSAGLSYHLVTVMRGREPGPKSHDILVPNIHRGERRAWKKQLEKQWSKNPHMPKVAARLLSRGKLDVKSSIKEIEDCMREWVSQATKRGNEKEHLYFKKDGSLTPYATAVARSSLFVELLTVVLHQTHVVGVVYNDSYHSNTDTSRGTPFATFGLLALPIEDCLSIPGLNYRLPVNEPSPEMAMCILQQLVNRAEGMKMSGAKLALYHGARFSKDMLRVNSCLVAMDRGTSTASDLLCMDRSTVAAWKAHATRGSYGDFLKDMSGKYGLPIGHPDRPRALWHFGADKEKFGYF